MDLGLPRAHRHRLRRLGRDRPRLRGVARPAEARTSPCSPAGADLLEREADRLGALAVRGDVTNPRHLERSSSDARRVRRHRRPRPEQRRPAAHDALDVTDEQVEDAVELLLLSAVRLVRLCRPHLEASGRGRVIAITSSAVKEPIDNLALSNAIRPGLTAG